VKSLILVKNHLCIYAVSIETVAPLQTTAKCEQIPIKNLYYQKDCGPNIMKKEFGWKIITVIILKMTEGNWKMHIAVGRVKRSSDQAIPNSC